MDTTRPAPVRRTLTLAARARGRLLSATLLGGASLACGVALLATSAWLIARAAERPSVVALGLAVVGVRFFAVARGVFRYGERLTGHDAALRVLADTRVDVYEHLETLAPNGLPQFRRADLLTRLVDDVDGLQDVMLRVVLPYGAAALASTCAVVIVAWILPAAGLILAAALVLAGTAVPALSSALARHSEIGEAEARAEVSVAFVDLVEGARDLAACGATARQVERVGAADAVLTRTARAAAANTGVGTALTTALTGLAMCGAVLVGVPAVQHGRIDGVLLAVIVLVPLATFEVVAGLPGAAQMFERVRRSAARVFAVEDAQPPVREPVTPEAIPAEPPHVVARDVRAWYDTDRSWALDGVDLDLTPGRRVAVVGKSGAGKSTLATALLDLVPYEGSVTLNGVEVARGGGEEVRAIVGLAAQDAHVFDTTLRENLLLARRTASDDELRDALRRARLLQWVEGLPLGLDTPVGEHGERLSGGQRQRLNLARVFLADFPVLVLDEPGEHLDSATADALVADVLRESTNRAVVLVTHRLAGLESMNEIVVLDAGRVIERGSHETLLAAGGVYTQLYELERGDELAITGVEASA